MTNTVILAKDGSTVWMKILRVLKHRAASGIKRRMWYTADADPAVDSLSQDSLPVKVGDFAYRVDDNETFICTVAPAATTDATFVQLNP